jgi:hypothetical protein
MNEAATASWLTTDPNFWTDLVRFATPGAVLLLIVWVLFRWVLFR